MNVRPAVQDQTVGLDCGQVGEIDQKTAAAADERGGNQLLCQFLERGVDADRTAGMAMDHALPIEYFDIYDIFDRDLKRFPVNGNAKRTGNGVDRQCDHFLGGGSG